MIGQDLNRLKQQEKSPGGRCALNVYASLGGIAVRRDDHISWGWKVLWWWDFSGLAIHVAAFPLLIPYAAMYM